MTNTTTLLKLIESRGWLKHHKVGKTKARGFLLDLRYPHNTATVIENDNGEAWAIDSWIPANAEFPDIMPLEAVGDQRRPRSGLSWRSRRGGNRNPSEFGDAALKVAKVLP